MIFPKRVRQECEETINGGVKIIFEFHEAIEAKSMKFEDLFEKVETTIKNSVI